MLQWKRIVSIFLTLALGLGLTIQVQASDIEEVQDKGEQLEEQKSEAQAEKNALTEQLNAILGEMEDTQKKLSAKELEIQKKEEELINAKVDENNQYESMKKRIKYMYENGNTEFIEILCASKSIGEFLNNAEYITTISEYDRDQLTAFQEIVTEVKRQEEELKSEYTVLTELREKLSNDQAAVEQLLENADMKLEDLEKQITTLEHTLADADIYRGRYQALLSDIGEHATRLFYRLLFLCGALLFCILAAFVCLCKFIGLLKRPGHLFLIKGQDMDYAFNTRHCPIEQIAALQDRLAK